MDPLWIFLSVGLGMGIILSVLFGIYNKDTNVYYVKNIFGMNSTNLILGNGNANTIQRD